MSQQDLSPQEATPRLDVAVPHDPPPPPGWVDPLEGHEILEDLSSGTVAPRDDGA